MTGETTFIKIVVKNYVYVLTKEQGERIKAEPMEPNETRHNRYFALIQKWGLKPSHEVPHNIYSHSNGFGPPLPRNW